MTTPTDPEFDLLLHVLARWKRITLLSIVGLAAGIAYALLATEWYSARLTVLPSLPQGAQRSGAALSLAANLPAALDSTSADVHRISAVLASNSVADEVIAHFDLMKRYHTAHIEHARAALWQHCSTATERKSGLVSLSCEDTDPKLAAAITGYFGEVGNKVFGRISVSSAREERRFLESQVDNARKDVDTASQKLRDFQETHKLVDLPEQSKAVIGAMASIKGDMISKQLELSYLSSFSARTESSVVQLEQQIAIMESKLKQLEAADHVVMPVPSAGSAAFVPTAGSASTGSAKASDAKQGEEFFPGAMVVPELRFELEQLIREQKIQETVFFLLTQRYETAKIDEARDTSTFQILDTPTVPTYRSRPQRKKVALAGLGLGLVAALATIIIPLWFQRRRLPHAS